MTAVLVALALILPRSASCGKRAHGHDPRRAISSSPSPGGTPAREDRRCTGSTSPSRPGQFVSVIGSNGAGKSTLLRRSPATSRQAPGGSSSTATTSPGNRRRDDRRGVARVFQDPLAGSCGQLTIEENLALAVARGRRGAAPAVRPWPRRDASATGWRRSASASRPAARSHGAPFRRPAPGARAAHGDARRRASFSSTSTPRRSIPAWPNSCWPHPPHRREHA